MKAWKEAESSKDIFQVDLQFQKALASSPQSRCMTEAWKLLHREMLFRSDLGDVGEKAWMSVTITSRHL